MDLSWIDEKAEMNGIIYKIVCFLLRKKLSYKELYMMFYNLNKNSFEDSKAKERSMKKVIEIYKKNHNNKLPNGIKI